jgi:hypothetical protein
MSDPFEEAGRRIGRALRRGPPIESHQKGCTCGHESCGRVDLAGDTFIPLGGFGISFPALPAATIRVVSVAPAQTPAPHAIVDPEGLWAPENASPEDLARRKRIRDAMDKASKRKPRNNRGRR